MKLLYAIFLSVACTGFVWTAAAEANDQRIYEAQVKLEELGYDPGKPDGIRGSKTVIAIKRFQEDSGLPVTGRLDEETIAKLNEQNEPPQFSLNEAVRLNDIVLIKGLIDAGADVNFKDQLDETPLHVAVIRGYREIAALLIEKGADIGARDVRGLTPLHAAAWRGSRDAVELLIIHGAVIDARDKDLLTPLHTACLSGRAETVALLIEKGADVNAKNKNSLTPLHVAALSGDTDTATLLIDKGADVNARNKDGLTPLHMASQQEHQEVVLLLKKHRPKK
jgi:ankyrin repeat protein